MVLSLRKPNPFHGLEEKILSSPEVKSEIDKLARRKLDMGTNPVEAYFEEQLNHLKYHMFNFLAINDGAHPELEYKEHQRVLKDSGRYFSKAVLYSAYHLRSFFSGKDDFENVALPEHPELSFSSNLDFLKQALKHLLSKGPFGYVVKV